MTDLSHLDWPDFVAMAKREWITHDGEVLRWEQMAIQHLINAANLIEHDYTVQAAQFDEQGWDLADLERLSSDLRMYAKFREKLSW